jgi:hypothetical protein
MWKNVLKLNRFSACRVPGKYKPKQNCKNGINTCDYPNLNRQPVIIPKRFDQRNRADKKRPKLN